MNFPNSIINYSKNHFDIDIENIEDEDEIMDIIKKIKEHHINQIKDIKFDKRTINYSKTLEFINQYNNYIYNKKWYGYENDKINYLI